MNNKYRRLYDYKNVKDLYILKSFNNNYYKLALIRRKENIREDITKEFNSNEQKLSNNLARASSKILEIALCNEWGYFFTGTIDPKKYDRSKFDLFYKDFSKWLQNYNARKGLNIKYIIIPELHLDKENWHMHGLIQGLPAELLTINKFGYLDWPDYSAKFGYCSFADVYDNTGVSLYVTKYIKKNVSDMTLMLGNYLYYCSKGLKRADKIFEGNILSDIDLEFDYQNDFCKVKSFKTEDEMKQFFKNSNFIEKI